MTMATQKMALSASAQKLDDNRARALILQCLFSSIGEGISAPEIHRFIAVQSAKPVSKFRIDEMLEDLVKVGHIDLHVKTSKGGRITRKYEIVGCGLIHLSSISHLLPREIRKENVVRFTEIYKFALETIEKLKTSYKENITIDDGSEIAS